MKRRLYLLWPVFFIIANAACTQRYFKKHNETKTADKSLTTLSMQERTFLITQLESSIGNFKNTVANLTNNQFSFRPAADKWTIAECIEHIALAELEFPKILARENWQPPNKEYRSKIKIADNEIQPKMTSRKWKAKSPEVFKPSNKFSSVAEAITAFQTQRKTTIAYVETTEDDLRNHYWKHPLTGTIDLYQTLILMSAHVERHTEQIEQIKSNKKFPKI
jgi:hypothetical protein